MQIGKHPVIECEIIYRFFCAIFSMSTDYVTVAGHKDGRQEADIDAFLG